jgi:hypothetical protein
MLLADLSTGGEIVLSAGFISAAGTVLLGVLCLGLRVVRGHTPRALLAAMTFFAGVLALTLVAIAVWPSG